jgi:amidase
MPELRHYTLPLIEKEGDEGIRTAVRFMFDNIPPSHATEALSYMKSLSERTRLIREWALFLDRVPLVLTPVCSEPIYQQGFDIESAARTASLWSECATMMAIPVLGLPAVAVPTGAVDGLPMGVQIVGPRFREDLCLAAAEAIEARRGVLTPIDPRW